ncbi:twin-arginine translocase TatA/TatE family subunit [Fictibacillus enclensis]|uniref:twin-arginine translocase TatA/TatE family subunit n=1 Tax=Fictibacillus enclensis TaxID=1017270 RepID=UPI0025A14469|nr:twin-arginine translocase TatA/TatE family subunit [Fictibacillus enclensis]MDM5198985.1 twin-arginine translocase TatA/TatE family subunit [Fictibacillus enclensis]
MFSSIGPTGIILLAIVALLLFGPKKLPELGRAVGRTVKEFKDGTKELMSDEDDDQKHTQYDVNKTEAQKVEASSK